MRNGWVSEGVGSGQDPEPGLELATAPCVGALATRLSAPKGF